MHICIGEEDSIFIIRKLDVQIVWISASYQEERLKFKMNF